MRKKLENLMMSRGTEENNAQCTDKIGKWMAEKILGKITTT